MPLIYPLAAAFGLVLGQYLIWFYAPVEQTMGLIQKIFYLHLPLAWWSLASFFTVFIASVLYLLRGKPAHDRLAQAACEIGVALATLALITGSLWARPIWNTWWTWDPKLTTTLVMWFIYMSYLLLRSAGLGGAGNGARVSAVLGVVAFLDVPLVFFAARKWRSIHPTVFGNASGGLEPEMLTTALVCVAAFGFFWLALLVQRTRQLRLAARLDALARKPQKNKDS
ncbi:MAG: cytochrome c biogenesis protein CcsA [Desulfovibrionaceae bacterium]|nr:cytochrome c biogenesis protein CcsA [Desulfovibrionaceae bacterium]MBF0514933.1 cytochrome c biogenesis protein CcsA [Desulfovibrionaceae bacterium]